MQDADSPSSSPPPLLKVSSLAEMDGPPDDKEGFFGHPLTRAEIAINGEAQQDAQRDALLHEYMNLQAWDKQSGLRIRDCFGTQPVGVASGGSPGVTDVAEGVVGGGVVVSRGGGGSGGGGVGVVVSSSSSSPSSVVVSDCSVPVVGKESGHGNDKLKSTHATTTADDFFILLDPQNNELGKFGQFDPILQGDPQIACPEVGVPFPDPAVELDVTSASLGEIKSEDRTALDGRPGSATHLHKATILARRQTQPCLVPPLRSLRRSESEPCATLSERVCALGDQLSVLDESALEDDPFSAESLVREVGAAARSNMANGGRLPLTAGEAVVRVHGATQTPSTSGCVVAVGGGGGLNAGLTAASSSGVPPRGRCIISSSSGPNLRISPGPNPSPLECSPVAPAKGAARGKGRGSSKGGGQARDRGGGQKEGGGGGRGKASKRRHTVSSTTASSTFLSSSSCVASSLSLPTTTSSSSSHVLSSTLFPPPEVCASGTGIPEAAGLTSGVSGLSAALPPNSPASVLLLPLAHSTVLTLEPESSSTLVLPHQPHHGHLNHSSGAQATAAQPEAAAEAVKQTTKDKLKLRITAQTAMSQMAEHELHQHQQHQHHQHHQQQQQQLTNGHGEMQGQHVEAAVPPGSYSQSYQLHPLHQHQQLQVQQHPSSCSPEQPPLPYSSEEELAAINMSGGRFSEVLPDIKQEGTFLDYDPHGYPPPYSSSEASLHVLYNSVPMATSSVEGGHPGVVSMAPAVAVGDGDGGGRESQALLSEESIFSESLLVQSQFLHLLQPVDMGQPPHNQQQQPPHNHHHHHQQQQQQQSEQNINSGYYNPTDSLYIYTTHPDNVNSGEKVEGTLLDMDSEKNNALQYVQQQQQHHHHQQQQQFGGGGGYGGSNGYHHQQQQQQQQQQQYVNIGNVDTSPDSGIGHDPGLSPNGVTTVMALKETSGSDGTTRKEGKSQKKRKTSQTPVLQRQCSSGSDKAVPRNPAIQKLEVNTTGYQYCLDTPISTTQRIEEDKVTYLNKSQYYPLILENTRPARVPKGVMCKSVIMLVFREEKSQEEEAKAWQFWHSRQHSYKQRILDIDTKNSQGVGPNSISELAFNAVSVRWNPREGPVRVNIAVHCLSTDFSNQKGVKGIPLHIQCDTYELFDSSKDLMPSHRGYCQIKVFCDKGAERKTRDEERRRTAKVTKPPETAIYTPGRKRSEDVFHPPCDRSDFYSMADLSTSPVYFSPSYASGDCQPEEPESAVKKEDSNSQQSSCQSEGAIEESTPAKHPRLSSCASCNKFLTPLLYVRENHDKAYHAIHLELPTVEELLKAISYKFNKQLRNVTNFYKRSKNGMLVRMDDDIIRRYSHETAFLLEIHNEGCVDMEVILLETTH